MRSPRPFVWLLGLALLPASAFFFGPPSPSEGLALPGLEAPVRVVTDRNGVRHVFAKNDLDLARAQGFVHARDRFFQMDAARRQVSGDLAELLGPSVLADDVELRTLGLRRAAERSLALLSERERAVLDAYAAGVNHFLATQPLPPEYAVLELTQARPWDAVDTLAIGKAIAAGLSLDLDISQTLQLNEYVVAGALQGFDGQALFFEDVRRAAPMDPAATVPDAGASPAFITASAAKVDATFLARAAEAARRYRERAEDVRFLARAMRRQELQIGSNEWGVSARKSAHGRPMIANDPHLSLDWPSTFYEIHLVVDGDPEQGDMNVSGVAFPGAPGVILGQNERITWGATTNPMDVSDIFMDTLLVGPACPPPTFVCIQSEGALHPVRVRVAEYRVNQVGDGVPDNVVDAGLPLAQRTILTVPFRSFGPVLQVTDPSVLATGGETQVLVLQFTGFHATREVATFLAWNRAHNLEEFVTALADFDFGSQNWAYADAEGNLAYFSSAELPLRRDLEQGTVAGLPPFFIRDGSGPANWVPDPARSQGQAIPFAILPFEEMPQVVNPPAGFFVNANNDPVGVSLDNNPLNQVRASKPTAIFYLNPSFANGLRAGRITRLVKAELERSGRVSFRDMKRFQANTQQLDAELLVPFLLRAFENAQEPGAAAPLAELGGDEGVADAVRRLARWDFSTPTGIPEGYDASDPFGERLSTVPARERAAAAAATLYNVWRGQLIRATVDRTLAEIGVSGVGSSDALKAVFHLLSQDPFTGVGASGVDFFPEIPGLDAEERRDATLLQAMRDTLELLASDTFAPAFENSTDPADYLWGKLHRITFDHPLGPPFSLPPAAGFEDLAPDLPGLSRDGGFEVVNASGFSARADGLNEFRFGGGSVRRYVGLAGVRWAHGAQVLGVNAIPGGPSGVLGSPLAATQLPKWLTADYHLVTMSELGARIGALAVEILKPAEP